MMIGTTARQGLFNQKVILIYTGFTPNMIIGTTARQGLFKQKVILILYRFHSKHDHWNHSVASIIQTKSDFNFIQNSLQARSLEPQQDKDYSDKK